jgi:putative membrane protein
MNPILPSIRRSAALLLAAFSAISLAAQNTSPTLPPGAPPPSSTVNVEKAPPKLAHHDQAFIEKANEAGIKEVAVSQAVMNQLTKSQVRDFANAMITDHTAANLELGSLAAVKGVTLPMVDTAKITEKWSGKVSNVDKGYVNQMVEDHEDAVELFEKASKSDDPDVRAFALKMLPTLQHHLKMAKDLKKSM